MHSSSSQKMNIGVSRDMQSTNYYTIKKQIQTTATVNNWSDPPAVIQVISKIGLSFEIP